ncbi:MAG: NADH-quinone oxidoreductase subunit N [Chloroflexia bacterium]
MEPITAPSIDYGLLAPLAAPVLGAMLLLILGAGGRLSGRVAAALTLLTTGVSWAMLLPLWDGPRSAFDGMLVADDFLVYTGGLLLAVLAVSVLLSVPHLERQGLAPAEYYALLLFVVSGGLMLLAASNLLMMLIGLEVLSLGLYVLTGYAREKRSSDEASMKYFLLGAFSIGFMIYGIALLYGAAGTVDYNEMTERLDTSNGLAAVGLGMIFVGFAFKLALAPFHMWTPDAYVGAPTSVTAFMSVATKVAVFGALIRLLATALPNLDSLTSTMLVVLATATMMWGAVAAVVQTDLKRLLAYSSIGQAGYVLTALIAGAEGRIAVLFYLLAYAVGNLGAFAAVIAASDGADERLSLPGTRGLVDDSRLSRRCSACSYSLAGIPPTAGFWAKLFAFQAAVSQGYFALAAVGVLTSAVAAYYYIRVIALMHEPLLAPGRRRPRASPQTDPRPLLARSSSPP